MCRIKNSNGVLVEKSVEEVEVWKINFESLMNVSGKGRAKDTYMGVQIVIGWPHPQEEVERSEMGEAVKKFKTGRACGIDSIAADMLKYEGDAVLEWMLRICNLAWQ